MEKIVGFICNLTITFFFILSLTNWYKINWRKHCSKNCRKKFYLSTIMTTKGIVIKWDDFGMSAKKPVGKNKRHPQKDICTCWKFLYICYFFFCSLPDLAHLFLIFHRPRNFFSWPRWSSPIAPRCSGYTTRNPGHYTMISTESLCKVDKSRLLRDIGTWRTTALVLPDFSAGHCRTSNPEALTHTQKKFPKKSPLPAKRLAGSLRTRNL